MNALDSLFHQISAKDVLLFIGAGFSIPCGLPSGNSLKCSLAKELENRTGLDLSERSLQDVCDILKGQIGETKFLDLLGSYLDIPSEDTSSHDLLASIPFFDNIVTTNYDTFIEDAYGDKCIVKASNKELSLQEKNRVCIYKIHGDFSHREQIVISRGDYAKFQNGSNQLIWNEVKGLMSKKSILFIGYSIEDVHVYDYLFELISTITKTKKKYRHAYYVAPTLTKEDKRLLRLRKIVPINKTGQEFLTELERFLKSSVIKLYKKKEVDKTSLSKFLKENNISVKMGSSDTFLTDFKPIDASKTFFKNVQFSLGIKSLDKENIQQVGTITTEGSLKIPAENLHNFIFAINDLSIMNQSDIDYIELLPIKEEIVIRVENAEGNIIRYSRATYYRNHFSEYSISFRVKRKIYSFQIDLDLFNRTDKANFSLTFHKVKSDYTGLKEELRELLVLTGSCGNDFTFKMKDKIISPVRFNFSLLAKYVRKAILYYSCLNELIMRKDLWIDELPIYTQENLGDVLLLYSYYFEKFFDASILKDSELTLSFDCSPFLGVNDFVDNINNKHNAFKLLGEVNNFSFANVQIQNVFRGLIIKNTIKQEVIPKSREVCTVKITSKPSDYIIVYADNADKIDVILSDYNNILDTGSFDK